MDKVVREIALSPKLRFLMVLKVLSASKFSMVMREAVSLQTDNGLLRNNSSGSILVSIVSPRILSAKDSSVQHTGTRHTSIVN